MPEEQAFSVLVKIMFDYGLRELFKQNFEDLHCKFYQLERLMQVKRETSLALATKSATLGRTRLMNLVPRSSGDCLSHPGLRTGLMFFISHSVVTIPRLIRCEPSGCELVFQSHKRPKDQMTL